MTSVHLSQPAQGDLCPLNSRSSSATLYVTRLSCNSLDSAADLADMIIAQGLLRAGEALFVNAGEINHLSFV
jgi:hypothetical protein